MKVGKRSDHCHGTKQRPAIVEILAEFPQALTGKGRLAVLPLVDLSLPTLIGPGGGAEADERREYITHGDRSVWESGSPEQAMAMLLILTRCRRQHNHIRIPLRLDMGNCRFWG